MKENDLAHQRSMENLTSILQTVGNAIIAGFSSLTQVLRQHPWSYVRETQHMNLGDKQLNPYTY